MISQDDDVDGTIKVTVRRPDGSLPSVAELTDEIMHALYLTALNPGQQPCPNEWEKNRGEIETMARETIEAARSKNH